MQINSDLPVVGFTRDALLLHPCSPYAAEILSTSRGPEGHEFEVSVLIAVLRDDQPISECEMLPVAMM